MTSPSVTPSASSSSAKDILLSPNLGLTPPRSSSMTPDSTPISKDDKLPSPPLPEDIEPLTATSILMGTGALAVNSLGSVVMGVGSVAVSALTSHPTEDKAEVSLPESLQPGTMSKEATPETMLGAVLTRAASLASSAASAITGTTVSPSTTPSSPDLTQEKAIAAKQPRRASTFPIQYTADGTPFSLDPGISAMQRIPDHPCGKLHPHHSPIAHCCSAPDLVTTAVERLECRCKCYALSPSDEESDKERHAAGCQCICHQKAAYVKGESGHFHRVEQLVKGTRRVVRDIKNVL